MRVSKAARFIRFWDCYNIPIITFVDVPGLMPSIQEEEKRDNQTWGKVIVPIVRQQLISNNYYKKSIWRCLYCYGE